MLVVAVALAGIATVDVGPAALVEVEEAPSPASTTADDDDDDDDGDDEADPGVALAPVHASAVDCVPGGALTLDPSTVIAVAVPTSSVAVTVVAPYTPPSPPVAHP